MPTPARVRSSHPATTVLIDGAGAGTTEVVRCVRQVLRTVPSDTRVRLLTRGPVRLEPRSAKRVRVTRLPEGTAPEALASAECAEDHFVILVPACFSVSGEWLAAVRAGARAVAPATGVMEAGGHQLLAASAGVDLLTSPRTPWSALPGVVPRQGAGVGDPAQVEHRTLSAVLIVKDEEDVLGDCLRAAAPFVDEVVVYDTGSTDGTVAIARGLGAIVVQGYWNDDFADARNRALLHASSDWVLTVDADEVAQGEPRALRRLIDTATTDAICVSIISTSWGRAEGGSEIAGLRLFRRGTFEWSGALHEQLVRIDGGTVRGGSCEAALRLVHSGYTPALMAAKDKGRRNLAIAEAAIRSEPTTGERDYGLVANYARSLALAGHVDEALQQLDTLLGRPAASGAVLQAARVAIRFHLLNDDAPKVEAWLVELERGGESPGSLTVWRAKASVATGEPEGARRAVDALLRGGPAAWGRDIWGVGFPSEEASHLLADLDLTAGRHEQALQTMLAVLDRSPDTVDVPLLFRALEAAGGELQWLVGRSPEQFLERSLRTMATVNPRTSLPWLTAFHEVRPEDHRPVAAGCVVAARTDWLTALTWSVRAREMGLAHLCPLRSLAQDDARPALDRCMAWSLLAEGLTEEDALANLVQELEALAPEDLGPVLAELSQHTPATIERLTPQTEPVG